MKMQATEERAYTSIYSME